MKQAVRELAGTARAAWRRSRALRIAVLAAAFELVLRWVFSAVGRSRGLVSPGGALHADVAVLGAAYVVTRVVVRFAIPALVAGAIAAALLQRIATSAGPRRPGSPPP